MKLGEIQKKAKDLGIKPDKKTSKADLVRLIQKTEGNTPCFNTSVADCPHDNCCFRDDCDCC